MPRTVMPSAQIVVQTIAGKARLGAAAATVSLSRSLGSATGTALFGSVVFSLLQGLKDLGFSRPTPIQADANAYIKDV